MSDIKSILIVCTGNSCRSVMAEGLLKKYLKESGKTGIEVLSAGIRALDGFSPTEGTIETMKAEGIDMTHFVSRAVTDGMIKKADLILVMEDLHKEEVISRVPDAEPKTFLLKEYGTDKETGNMAHPGISDPIGRPIEYYKTCMAEIKKEVERIIKLL